MNAGLRNSGRMILTLVIAIAALFVVVEARAFAQSDNQKQQLQEQVATPEVQEPLQSKSSPAVLTGTVITRVEEVTRADAGPHAVEVAEGLVLRDNGRNKSISVEVCYPKTQSRFPVVIFSHGAIASARDYRLLAAFWASHGYVCVLPTHDDALTLHMTPGSKVSVVKLMKLAKVTPASIEQRQMDIEKMIDALSSLPDKVPALKDKIDLDNIAVAGHHAGAFAAEASAGASIGKANKEKLCDKRIKAVVAITGRDWRQPDILRNDLDQVKLPMMLISLSIDGKSLAGSRERMYRAMEQAPSGNKFVVTADVVGDIDKPTLATIRKAVKHSNVELISFHPFKRLRSAFRDNDSKPAAAPKQESIKVTEVAESERVGANVLESLGLGSLLPERADRGGFNFLMSFTLPFLDGYLKNDRAALERLAAEDGRTFGNVMVAKIERY